MMPNTDEIKPFELEEEDDKEIKKLADEHDAIFLCIIAPFTPLRVAPRRMLFPQFSTPDEYVIEKFVGKVNKKFSQKKRPTLYILIHSPGGAVSTSYMIARVLRNNFNKIVGFIPHMAASGASLVALSCNELVMGDISYLTSIDPHYDTDGETIFALSIVRSFNNLQGILGTKTEDEISYPYRHLTQSITAEKYDVATHSLMMVENYARELMHKSGYKGEEIKKIIEGMLYEIETHEQLIPIEKAKELGIKVKHIKEDKSHQRCWEIMKKWLEKYYLQPSPVHVIRYCFPSKRKRFKKKK